MYFLCHWSLLAYFKALMASPNRRPHCFDAQYYLFQILWSGIGKLHQEKSQECYGTAGRRSVLTIWFYKLKKCQTMIENMYNLLTWNKYLSIYLFVYLCRYPSVEAPGSLACDAPGCRNWPPAAPAWTPTSIHDICPFFTLCVKSHKIAHKNSPPF